MAITYLFKHNTITCRVSNDPFCARSAHTKCALFLLFDTLFLQTNGDSVKKIGPQTTIPKLLRRGDARRPLSGRFRPFLAPLQDAQHLKQARFFTTWTDGDVGLGKVLL